MASPSTKCGLGMRMSPAGFCSGRRRPGRRQLCNEPLAHVAFLSAVDDADEIPTWHTPAFRRRVEHSGLFRAAWPPAGLEAKFVDETQVSMMLPNAATRSETRRAIPPTTGGSTGGSTSDRARRRPGKRGARQPNAIGGANNTQGIVLAVDVFRLSHRAAIEDVEIRGTRRRLSGRRVPQGISLVAGWWRRS